jgi:flavin-binding protein dodecin
LAAAEERKELIPMLRLLADSGSADRSLEQRIQEHISEFSDTCDHLDQKVAEVLMTYIAVADARFGGAFSDGTDGPTFITASGVVVTLREATAAELALYSL